MARGPAERKSWTSVRNKIPEGPFRPQAVPCCSYFNHYSQAVTVEALERPLFKLVVATSRRMAKGKSKEGGEELELIRDTAVKSGWTLEFSLKQWISERDVTPNGSKWYFDVVCMENFNCSNCFQVVERTSNGREHQKTEIKSRFRCSKWSGS